MTHILEAQQFEKEYLEALFKRADTLREKRDESLRGRIMASLFFEPSTRTRLSFEAAMMRLGGNVITAENARDYSSSAKGETLEDTIRIASQYADVIVIRHFEAGAAAKAAVVSAVPVINAGDGAGQHPTQALLDLYTLAREKDIEGSTIAVVGDLKNGRAARSFVYLLAKFKPGEIIFVSPSELSMQPDIKDYLVRHHIRFRDTERLEDVHDADAIYQTRIQKERFATPAEYEKFKGRYVLTSDWAAAMKEHAVILHPLPRIDEITPDVDASPHARYFEQAQNGLYVRMALLADILS